MTDQPPTPEPGTGSGTGSVSGQGPGDVFATTRWTLVLTAGRRSTPDAERALGELCAAYWYPLYAYVRRQGYGHADAEDRVQAFFGRFLEKNWLEGLSADRGRFRAFLLACLKNFLANERDRERAQKRGGGVAPVSLDWRDAEGRFALEPADPRDPEVEFDREWGMALLGRVLERLRAEFAAGGRTAFFEKASLFLSHDRERIPYARVAGELGMEEGALRVAVHRLRKRYREVLRDEIAGTLSDPGMVEEELRALRVALAG